MGSYKIRKQTGSVSWYLNMHFKDDDESKNFQRKLSRDQIIASGIITLGCTIFAIGASLWILSIAVLDNIIPDTVSVSLVFNQTTVDLLTEDATLNLVTEGSSIINLDALSKIVQYFLVFGLLVIVLGFMFAFLPSRKKNKKVDYVCFCGNVLPCPIHENKSAPV